jgi:hypothetical protein
MNKKEKKNKISTALIISTPITKQIKTIWN